MGSASRRGRRPAPSTATATRSPGPAGVQAGHGVELADPVDVDHEPDLPGVSRNAGPTVPVSGSVLPRPGPTGGRRPRPAAGKAGGQQRRRGRLRQHPRVAGRNSAVPGRRRRHTSAIVALLNDPAGAHHREPVGTNASSWSWVTRERGRPGRPR